MSSVIERELESVELEDVLVDTATGTEPIAADPAAAPAPEPLPTGAVDDGTVAEAKDVVIGGIRVDKLGRMHRADGTVMSRAEQEAARGAAPAPAAVAPAVAAPQNEPYAPNVYGRPMADVFPGALKNPAGDLYFPNTVAPRVEQLVARGLRYDEFRKQSADAKSELDRITRRTKAEADALGRTLLVHVSTPDALQALADRVAEVGAPLAHQELSLAIREAALALTRDFGAPAAAPGPTEHTTPLDKGEAAETFESYWRDQMANPAYHGMPPALQQQVRRLLSTLPLFGIDRDGDWALREEVGDSVWEMAKATMDRERTITSATATNTAGRRPNPTAVSRIPPTAASPSPVGTGTARAAPKKPVREFANPFDAIRYADLTTDS